MIINVDLSRYRPAGEAVIEPGRYKVQLVACEDAVSRAGNPMLVWSFMVSEGPNAGTVIRSYTSDGRGDPDSFLEQKLLNHLVALGYKGGPIDTEDLLGRYCTAIVTHRDWETPDGEVMKMLKIWCRPLTQQAQPKPESRRKADQDDLPY